MSIPLIDEKIRLGMMIVRDERASALPLEHTSVTGQILGPVATVAVTQRFSNPLAGPAELEYLFPLPQTAAIIGFEIQVGKRTIQGELKELEQAHHIFGEARRQGQRAGLLEQRRPNLFSVQLTNVLPGETLLATLRYQERLSYDDGCYQFVFPMGLTPRYHSSQRPGEGQGGEGEGLDAPIALPGEKVGPVEISLSIDAGLPVADPLSPSHTIAITRLDDRRLSLRLAEPALPDHDFVLRYPAANRDVTLPVWTAKGSSASGSNYFLATLLPPPLDDQPSLPAPREFIFVLDRSGSMSGEPIVQARNALRACLRALNPDDRFRILLFDDLIEWYQSEASPASQEAVDAADRFLAQVEGRGGTEIVAALEAALALQPDPQRMRFVVFLTDGAVSAEEQALRQIRDRIGRARLFTFGIGPSVNRALLQRMAQFGRGTTEFLQLNEDIEGAVIRFQDRVSFPAVTDLRIEWKNCTGLDVYPSNLPDLYVGQPLEIVGRVMPGGEGPAALVVHGLAGKTGVAGQTAVTLPVLFPDPGEDPAIGRLWGRARLDDILDRAGERGLSPHEVRAEALGAEALGAEALGAEALGEEALGLALKFGLVSPYTAFVAVDREEATQGGKVTTLQVAQPLPAGLYLAGFSAPPTILNVPPPMAMIRQASMIEEPHSLLPGSRPAKASRTRFSLKELFSRDSSGAGLPGQASGPDALYQLNSTEPDELHEITPIPVTELLPDERAATLRWLARTQNMDGSWDNDIEKTSAALLTFIRSGHTPRRGDYRRQVGRAVEWLQKATADGIGATIRAAVLAELARRINRPDLALAADLAIRNLPLPTSEAERLLQAALQAPGKPAPVLLPLRTLDDLRLAALLGVSAPIPPELLAGSQGALARLWQAAMSAVL